MMAGEPNMPTLSTPPRNTEKVVLRISPQMMQSITDTARTLRQTKSDFIRKSLQRNLVYVTQNELPLVNNPKVKAALASSLEEQNGGVR